MSSATCMARGRMRNTAWQWRRVQLQRESLALLCEVHARCFHLALCVRARHERGICVVQVDEVHFGSFFGRELCKSFHALGDERMRETSHISPRDFAVGEECSVEVRSVHRLQDVFDARAGGIPFVP